MTSVYYNSTTNRDDLYSEITDPMAPLQMSIYDSQPPLTVYYGRIMDGGVILHKINNARYGRLKNTTLIDDSIPNEQIYEISAMAAGDENRTLAITFWINMSNSTGLVRICCVNATGTVTPGLILD